MRGFAISACLMLGCLMLGSEFVVGQESELKYEVASVKPSQGGQNLGAGVVTIRGFRSGPATNPERINFPSETLKTIILLAYGFRADRISGPGWLDSEKYDIAAKAPPGATDEQLHAMLRNLLSERFNLTLQHEARVMNMYELTVEKNGSKLKEADPNVPPFASDPGAPPVLVGVPDKAGFPQVPPGFPFASGHWSDGIMHWTGSSLRLSALVGIVERELGRPVVDKTGLTGKYDFTLAF